MKLIWFNVFLLLFLANEAGFAKEKMALPKELPFKLSELEKVQPHGQEAQKNKSSLPAYRISGQIAARTKSQISFRVPGFIHQTVAKPGDLVKEGDVLALLDPVDYELQLRLAQVNKNQAQIQEDIARNEFIKEKQLKLDGASTGSAFDQMESKYKQAQNGTKLADINLKLAQRSSNNTKLRAPYTCVVATQYKYNAERIGPENPIFDIYEVGNAEVQLNAPEVLMGKIDVGRELTISIPSVNFLDKAVVTKIVPIVSEQTRTFRITAALKNNNDKVVPGLFAEAHFN